MISVVIKTTGQIITPTDKLKFLTMLTSKIFVPSISAIIALVINMPDSTRKILCSFFFP